MAVSEDAQAIINAIESMSTAITNAISSQTTTINNNIDAEIQAQTTAISGKLDTIITHASNIDLDLDTVIDKESRVIRGMGLQGQALNASVSYKIKDPNGEQILEDLNNLDSNNG